MEQDPFREYLKEKEPGKRQRGYRWYTAIGLQAVDGLQPSGYLQQTAVRNIEGEISLEEAGQLLHTYYSERPPQGSADRTREADLVSLHIAQVLDEQGFSFTPNAYISVHRKLFEGVYPHAGKLREYNITKKEWVLDGQTVLYGSASELWPTLQYDFEQERGFCYEGLSMAEIIHHLAVFVSRLWQIHIFCEGNTRTTAVFFIQYLRSLGFAAANDSFACHAWYFRNALVRANYTDLTRGIHETTRPLELFLENLLLGTNHPLHSRTLHCSGALKPNMDAQETEHSPRKPNIEPLLTGLSPKAMGHTLLLWQRYGQGGCFGRADVMAATGLKATQASALLKRLQQHGLVRHAEGRGKGKVRFAVEVEENGTF